ncbi:MAG: hypothetical protein LBG58_05240 [Planctomycetaceae bacterium]|jgi:hypothetical protein|nr:hypothetical protein [Planctomycetaceae bacterium]
MNTPITQTTIPFKIPQTDNTLDVDVCTHRITKRFYPTIRKSVSSKPFYKIKKPANLNVVQNALQLAIYLRNEFVRKQTVELLNNIDTYLDEIINVSEISNRLPQIHLTEQEDDSVLAEWNFEYFRIGFSIEQEPDKSSCYVLFENRTTGYFKAETCRLGTEYQEIVSKIVNFVLVNC